ncbi:hypothetical protein NVP2275O_036 [Vibrio phage 2.275.O._10N.286.54.E11]|nr:hypothetical protein NVP2275O_036 [Vibrio phage 2.275.O._10N.286.54.E11]
MRGPLVMDKNQSQNNVTMFYFFYHTSKKNAELHNEIRDTLGGIAWVQIQVYGTDYISGLYTTCTTGQDHKGNLSKKWLGTRPVKITSTEEAHVTMSLAFSDKVLTIRENTKGGVMKVLRDIENEVDQAVNNITL